MGHLELGRIALPEFHSSSAANDAHFETAHLNEKLERKTFAGTAITIASQIVKVGLQVGAMVLLARLLTPKDYGSFGIISAVTSLGLVIKDMGFAAATLNSAELSQKQVSNVFWLTIAANSVLAVTTSAIGPFIGKIYNDAGLILPIVAMSLSFIILALGSQHYSLLRRQMRFRTLAVIDLTSLLCGIAAAVATAYQGGAVWALVNLQLGIALASTTLVWSCCKWRPSLPDRTEDIRNLHRFGSQILSFQLMDYIIRNADNLLIGKFCGAQMLGFYDRAFQLHMIPAQNICWPFGAVLLGTLSRAQQDKARFANLSSLTVFTTSAFCMPLVAFLFVESSSIVQLLLGAQWSDSANIFRALAPAAFVECVLLSFGWIFMAANRGERLFTCSMIQTICTVLSFFVGINWGAFGVAVALSITRILALLPTLFYCSNGTEIKGFSLFRACLEPMIASVVAASVIPLFPHVGAGMVALTVEGLVFLLCYTLIMLACPTTHKLLGLLKSRA